MVPKDDEERQYALSKVFESFGRGDWEQGERWARQLVEKGVTDPEALSALIHAIYQQGRAAEAIVLCERLLALDPLQSAYHNDYGVMLGASGRWPDAEAAHRMALVLEPENQNARFNLAHSLFRQQRLNEALEVLDVLQRVSPDFAEQFVLQGEILQAAKRPDEAAIAFSRALERGVQRADVFVHLASALSDAGDAVGANAVLSAHEPIDSEDAATNFYLGNLYRGQGNIVQAAVCFRKASALCPAFAEAENNLGLVLQEQGDTTGAEAAYGRALAAAPGMAAVHTNLGNVRLKQGQMGQALTCLKKAVELSPDSPEAWNSLGETHYRLLQLDEAEAAYRRALSINPNLHEAKLNLGILSLLRGEYPQGWSYFEERWEMPAIRERRPRFAQPEWKGEPLNGKTLLVYVEQGMGDNLQFVRYLAVLRALYPAAQIYYWGLRPLARLFSDLATRWNVELLPEVVPGGIPPIDYHIGLLSIPLRLGTSVEKIPADIPYIEAPDDLVLHWKSRLDRLAGKRVGFVWAGGESYLFHRFRAMALRQLMPLLDIEGVSWVSLQKGPAASQIAEEGLSGKIADWMDDVDDFADTAAIIANLDLVMSVDTSVAHLAGAMGKPVWLLNRFDTDWRWGLERSDCPWYPSMRIFRQASFGDWDSVVSGVTEALVCWGSGREVQTPLVAAQSEPTVLPSTVLRLNLGCGHRKMAGFVNVDCVEICQPDMVVDLEKTPWPWGDDSVEEIRLIHVLEHLGQQTSVFLSIIKEMYRVCRDGARIEIIVPHPRSDAFLGDPTHVRAVTGATLSLFSQRLNREWEALGAANTPLGLILGVDFEIESHVHTLDPSWQTKLSSGRVSEADIGEAVRQYNNVVSQSTIVWRVCKSSMKAGIG